MKTPSSIDAVAKETIKLSKSQGAFEVPACEFYRKTGLFRGNRLVVSLTSSKSTTSGVTRTVSEELLSYYSDVIEEKIKSPPVTSDSDEQVKTMSLDEWDVETFNMALQWMYSGNVIISKSSKSFDQVRSYIQFFKIVKALKLDGSLEMVKQNLKNALIAATEKEDDEDEDAFTCNSTFKEVLKDAFANPVDESVRELLASFLVEPYAKHLLTADTANVKSTAKTFKDLFNEVDGLELRVLRFVASLLNDMALGKPDSGGFSRLSMHCPLTGKKFATGSVFKRAIVGAK